jgi:FdrA protein
MSRSADPSQGIRNVQHVEVRSGAYADSVTLMQVSAQAQKVAGVQAALVAMGTELNLDLLAGLGLPAPGQAGPNDMLVAVAAENGESLASALAVIDAALSARPVEEAGGRAEQPPRTTLSAVRRSGPGLALISVPGQHAFAEAVDALETGCDVMIFSDNVPVEQEIWLKDQAAARDLLVLGPDCGTAIVGGVGLGFSHSVPAGPIGIVAASGTGAQQVICLLDAAGVGVSAVLGVGGRDLSAAVGGRSARAALAALDADPGTELIVLLSKPPADQVAAELKRYAAGLTTPVQFALIGQGQPDLTATAEAALRTLGRAVPQWKVWPPAGAGGQHAGEAARGVPEGRPAGGKLRGLFAGGTLCDEAMVIAAEQLGPVYSNIPLRPEWELARATPAGAHVMIDFGDDKLTAGRPHPMIDQRLRLDRLLAEVTDPDVAVILLDVVLGHGAHPDPASELAPAITAALAGRETGDLAVVVSLVGARSDPQGLMAQAAGLAHAGAHVFSSNAHAARFAAVLAGRQGAADEPIGGAE